MTSLRLLSLEICLFAIALSFFLHSANSFGTEEKNSTPAPAPTFTPQTCVAEINGDKITYAELAQEVLAQYGAEMLRDDIRRTLIVQACESQKINATQEEVIAEIRRISKAFGVETEAWLAMLEEERGIKPDQYIEDIIRPLVLMCKLAGQRLVISEDEIQREYETRFGASVKVRQIVLAAKNDADRVREALGKQPEAFEAVAKNQSLDTASKPFGGLVHPIRKHTTTPAIEAAVFALREGEISPVIPWAQGLFVIFKCEEKFSGQPIDKSDALRQEIVMKLRDVKTRSVSEEVFNELQQRASIEIFFGNPTKSAQRGDVAAIVNGRPITMEVFTARCVARKGEEALDEMINRTMVLQACRRRGVELTDAAIDREIREMAIRNLPLKNDGQPNVEQWLRLAIQERGTTVEQYRRNTVLPMLALKTLVRDRIIVTEEDVTRGFESNFGPKARCLGIVLDNQRRAMEVWQKANTTPSEENFGDLATKYSIDPLTRNSRGIMPLLQKHAGQSTLEKEAFNLQPGELSQIIQLDPQQWIILFCLGQTPAEAVTLDEVKHEIVADVYDKKLTMAIAQCYETVYASAIIDNYLTGQSSAARTANMPNETTPQR